jgi:dinuclear metal center YbgI/SA1388 family protein
MIERLALQRYIQDYLQINNRQVDYGPNGLQIEGTSSIHKIVTGVTASLALIEKAIELGAQALLVHHGLFWQKDPYEIIGYRKKRIERAIKADLNIFGYHLPLDAHPEVGNNVQLAKILGLEFERHWAIDASFPTLGWIGQTANPISLQALTNLIAHKLNRAPLLISPDLGSKALSDLNTPKIIKIAICTGAAQKFITELPEDIDVFITGEASESTTHLARELGVHFYAAGHHATERYGIKALGEHLAAQFGLSHDFVDIDNPI